MRRACVFKGSWYPADPEDLDRYVKVSGEGELSGAVLPHAGLFYSGSLISDFFTSLSPSVEHITVISPSHYFRLSRDTFYSAGYTSSATPYGPVETVPLELGVRADRALQAEHGIEMFLPFAAKKGLSVSYLLLSDVSSPESARRLSEELLEAVPPHSALIASSDFTHYGPSFGYTPWPGKDAKARTESWDGRAADLLSKSETETVFREYHRTSTICGLSPAMVVSAALSSLDGRTGRHYTSLDKSGDSTDFVDYQTVFWS